MICQVCNKNKATELHHLFSQTKLNKKLYPEFIHNSCNIIYICYNCHHNKAVPKLNEIEFCKMLGIEPRSKTGQVINKRGRNDF